MVITKASQRALSKSTERRRREEERKVLELVKQFTLETRLSPTYLELAQRAGCSVNKIFRTLHRLADAGKIELGTPGQARSIRIVRRRRLAGALDESLASLKSAIEEARP